MKKVLFILLLLPVFAMAAPVSQERARLIGEGFFTKSIQTNRYLNKGAHFTLQQHSYINKVRQNNGNYHSPYYIFNNEDGGFVIVAGDDCATPILGYSTEGSIDLDNLPIQLEELLNAYAEEIQQAVENGLQATDSIQYLWDSYFRAPQSQNATAVVNALISTSWDQYPRYNNRCPSDPSLSSLGGHPTTGCVATAMAQVMKYWEYPENGTGYKSYNSDHYGTLSANFGITAYDWANMPLKLSSSTSTAQNNAVATLMYHCGVAVSMNYNCDGQGGSGAYVVDYGGGRASAEKALKTYFGYASTVAGKIWGQSTSSSAWISMLKTELDNQRPMLYAGYNSNGGGHAFICDGYDSNNKFHFNWGWGGQANGFFTLTALTPGNDNFSEGQQAVIGIKPANGAGPAKSYDLYMNTDLEAQNTVSGSSLSEPNLYYYGNTMSFAAKVENNGTGIFNGSFRVAAFTDEGEFVAWSNESYHFSLEPGHNTVKKTYTFNGGLPFITGKYRAYMRYKDDDETGWGYVKTDAGTIMTEYNNVAFTVKIASGDLVPVSEFIPDDVFGSFISGSKLKISVKVKNTALLTTFYGKIRLNFYNLDGSLAQTIDEYNFSNGFPALTTKTLEFMNIVDVDPGTYYLALVYQNSGETSWQWMRSNQTYPNPVRVIIKARDLQPDEYEVNNTQSSATKLNWYHDVEMVDFDTWMASLHEDSDIDYYKLSFPNSDMYKVSVALSDKFTQSNKLYNADAEFAYSIGGNTYSDYYKNEKVITFNGPTTLYIRVRPFGMNGLGYYQIAGDVAEITPRDDCNSVPYSESFDSSQGDFTVYDAVLPSVFSSIWNWDSKYGMVASCIKGSTKYVSDSYLISPCIEIPMESQTILTFRHAAKFFENTSQMTLCISTDFDPANPSEAHWDQWPIPTYPKGNDWTWYDSGLIDLSGYGGQYINIAFHYTSNTNYAPKWEIKDFSLQSYKTSINDISIEQQPASKILLDGQIYILRGDEIYTITGLKIK